MCFTLEIKCHSIVRVKTIDGGTGNRFIIYAIIMYACVQICMVEDECFANRKRVWALRYATNTSRIRIPRWIFQSLFSFFLQISQIHSQQMSGLGREIINKETSTHVGVF